MNDVTRTSKEWNTPWHASGLAVYDATGELVAHTGITGNRSMPGEQLERMASMIAEAVNAYSANEPCPGEHEDPDFKREDGSCAICFPHAMESSAAPVTHQEIFSAVHQYAAEIAKLTAAVPVHCSAQPPSPDAGTLARLAGVIFSRTEMSLDEKEAEVAKMIDGYNTARMKEWESAKLIRPYIVQLPIADARDAARWRQANLEMCYSFDGQDRTYYLKAVGRETFEQTIDRRIALTKAGE